MRKAPGPKSEGSSSAEDGGFSPNTALTCNDDGHTHASD